MIRTTWTVSIPIVVFVDVEVGEEVLAGFKPSGPGCTFSNIWAEDVVQQAEMFALDAVDGTHWRVEAAANAADAVAEIAKQVKEIRGDTANGN